MSGEKKASIYEEIGASTGRLVAEKNKAYGDSFAKSGEIMRILYPDGFPLDRLNDALAIIRVVDKLFRIATRKDAFGENPWQDIEGYAILAQATAPLLEGEAIARAAVPVGMFSQEAADQERDRLLGIIDALISPKTDSEFDDEQNHYRAKVAEAFRANGWIEPKDGAAIRNRIKNALEGMEPSFARTELEGVLRYLR